jgi:hypothetical protein
MRYLANAYNRDDVTALHYVTTPSSFNALIAMRSEAVDLQLKSCAPTGHGDYNCVFRHRFPKRMHDSGHGESDFIAAPAINPGWYIPLRGLWVTSSSTCSRGPEPEELASCRMRRGRLKRAFRREDRAGGEL